MSQNVGVLVSAAIRPNDSLDLIASAFANEIKGGHHGYATLTERDDLITARREWGMFVTVYNDGANNGVYKLEYGYVDTDIDNNDNWVAFSGGGVSSATWLNSVIARITDPPSMPSGGDRYLIGTTASGDWFTNENKVAQYNDTLIEWNYTTPDDGYCVIVNTEPNVIYRYQGTYSNGNWIKQFFGGLDNKYLITNESIEVPLGHQYFIYGDLTIGTAGSLTNYGQVVTMNGDIIIESTGTFSNYGLYYSPIIDINKYKSNIALIAGSTLVVTHNLDTIDLTITVYNNVGGVYFPIIVDVKIINTNQVTVLSAVDIPNARINIIG